MRDPGLRDRGSELRVGALVLAALATLVVGLYWISDFRIGQPSMRLTGVATTASQVTTDSKIFLRGVEVGDVDEIRLQASRVVLSLTLYARVDMPADTRGTIQPAGFLGAQMIDLVPGSSSTSLAEGDTIQLGSTSDLASLASGLGDQTNLLLERAEEVLSERMVENLNASSEAFASTMRQLESLLASEREAIHSLVTNMNAASAQLAELTGSDELDRSLANLDTLSTRLAAASENFDETSESLRIITTRLADGEGSLGKMMTDDALYDGLTETLANLQAASEEIAILTKDIRERPDRYLKDIKISVF